jgi:hypothetical protein
MIRRGRMPFTVLGLVATAIALIFVGAKEVSGDNGSTQTGGRGTRGKNRTEEGQEPRHQDEPSKLGTGDELQAGAGKEHHYPSDEGAVKQEPEGKGRT